MFDFDRVIERRGTHATKWDLIARYSGIDEQGCANGHASAIA